MDLALLNYDLWYTVLLSKQNLAQKSITEKVKS